MMMKKKVTTLNELTPKQERFIQNVLGGMSLSDAYREAYNAENMADESIRVEAYRVFNNPNVALRYNQLMAELKDKMIMTAIEKRKLLRDIAYNKEHSVSDIIKAIETDNKMTGEYVTKIEGDIGIKKLEDVL